MSCHTCRQDEDVKAAKLADGEINKALAGCLVGTICDEVKNVVIAELGLALLDQ